MLFFGVFFPVEWIMRRVTYSRARHKVALLKSNGLIVIGITGSYGKSTTKYFLAHVLSAGYGVVTTEGSVNTPLALSRFILNKLRPSHNIFIVEIGD